MDHTGLWTVDTGGSTPSSLTGPVTGQSGTRTDNYAHIEASASSPGTISYLSTPTLSLLDGGVLEVYIHMYGAQMGNLSIEACSSTSCCSTLWFRAGQQHFSSSAAWTRVALSLDAGTSEVRFVGVRGSSYTSDMAVDTIRIRPRVTCSLFAAGATCDSTDWCSTQSSSQSCRANVTCSSLAVVDDCGGVPSCSATGTLTTAAGQCDGWEQRWSGGVFIKDAKCFTGHFDPSVRSLPPADPAGNGCLAANASSFIGTLYYIEGIVPGTSRIIDGGSDMYDAGNNLKGEILREDNTCLATNSSSFMGNLWSIQGVATNLSRIADGGSDSELSNDLIYGILWHIIHISPC